MRGRKPIIGNIIPMKTGESADQRRDAVARMVENLRPTGLSPEVGLEWTRVANILASPNLNRLQPHYVDVISEYCHATVRLRTLRAAFPTIADEVRTTSRRHGTQIKSHPHVGQIHETWRQWRSMVAMLGLSPTDERNLITGNQGDMFDESDNYLA
jgi:P27 family predicted phage terminase small subunit